jgi:hypothetical protein
MELYLLNILAFLQPSASLKIYVVSPLHFKGSTDFLCCHSEVKFVIEESE